MSGEAERRVRRAPVAGSAIDPNLWRRAAILFERAADRAEGEREAFLASVCGSDVELRRAVEELLAFDEGDLEGAPEPSVREEVAPGRRLGAYRLLHPLGQGGMGRVWLAERAEGEVEQRVAIKWIEGPVHPWIVPLFRRERQILARLEHPNIARFLDGGTSEEGFPYAVLEHVEGVPLTSYCDSRRLGVPARIALFLKVCGAVQYAHQNLVVHRDLKPDNILVTDEGEPKLLDFGIAKSLDLTASGRATAARGSAVTVGRFLTPDYASPEQLEGSPVAMASDLYTLGVLLHEMLTGTLPRRPEARPAPAGREPELPSDLAARGAAANGETPEARAETRGTTPRRLRRQLRGDLDAIVLRCLRRDPRERYGSVERLADDLRRHLEGLPVEAQTPSLRYRCAKFVRRHALAVGAGVALGLAALGFVGVTASYSRQVERERDAARRAQKEGEAIQEFLFDAFRFADPYQGVEVGARGGRETTVSELLDRSTVRLASDLRDQPLVQARLLQSLGGVELNLGRYSQALALLRRSLDLRRRELGAQHPEVQISLGLLGHALYTVGKLDEAEPLLEESLRLARTLPGLPPQILAEALTNYGMLQDDRGRLPEAKAALGQALAVYRRSYSAREGARPLAILCIQLGGVLYQLRELPAAELRLREALGLLRARGLAEHPDTASALHYLAKVEAARGRYGVAEEYFRRALAMRIRLQGADHPQTAVARDALEALLAVKRAAPPPPPGS